MNGIKKLFRLFLVGIAIFFLLTTQNFVSAQTVGSCDWYEADQANNLPAGYYQFNGGDAGSPNNWSRCNPGGSTCGGDPQKCVRPTLTYDGPDCINRQSCWVKRWSDGRQEQECYGEVPGQCGVEQPPPVCTWQQDGAGECDWNTHTVWNVDVNSCDGTRRRTTVARNNALECGYQAPQQQPAQTRTQQAPINNCSVPVGDSTCRDGRIWFCKKEGPECNGGNCMVNTGQDCSEESEDGEDDDREEQTRQPAPTPTPTPAPGMAVCPSGTTMVGTAGSTIICGSPAGGTTSNPPINISNPINVTAQGGTSNVNVTQTAPQPRAQLSISSRCPLGSEARITGNEVVCLISQPKVVTVAGDKTEALPKTGLPALFWVGSAFLPLGFGLRRFKTGAKANWGSPSYLWEERRYKV